MQQLQEIMDIKKLLEHILSFLDADDVIAPNKIETAIKALSRKPEGLVASAPGQNLKQTLKRLSLHLKRFGMIQNPVNWCVTSWMGGGMMAQVGWLIPKPIIEKAGLWDENLSLHDDGEFMCRVLLASKGNVL